MTTGPGVGQPLPTQSPLSGGTSNGTSPPTPLPASLVPASMQYGRGLSTDLPPCVLNKTQLLELWQQIATGYDEPERTQRLKVSTRLAAGELTAPDMETFLNNPTVPLRFSELKIFALPSDDKNVTLSLSDAANTLEVSGASRIWVLGQREQVKEFVTQQKPRYAFIFRFTDSKRQAVLLLLALFTFALPGFLFPSLTIIKKDCGFLVSL